MINIIIEDSVVEFQPDGNFEMKWVVKHPLNNSILAYCSNDSEAYAVREAFNDLARQLRAIGFKVA